MKPHKPSSEWSLLSHFFRLLLLNSGGVFPFAKKTALKGRHDMPALGGAGGRVLSCPPVFYVALFWLLG